MIDPLNDESRHPEYHRKEKVDYENDGKD